LSKDLYNDGGAVTVDEGQKQSLSGLSKETSIDSQKGGESSGGQRNWMEKGPEDANMARRRAFLDAPNSMAGMRAVDAQLGRVRSGNDFFYSNPNAGNEGESEFVKVSLADGRAHQNGQMSGQDLLAKHVSKVKEAMPAESVVEGEFTQPPTDTPMTSANPADFPETQAFSPSDTAGKFSYDEEAERFSDPSFGY